MDEGKQFRVGRVTALAPDPQPLQSILRKKLRQGDIFNQAPIKQFYQENKSLLPPDASPDDLVEKQNEKFGTVDLVFDFRTCHEDP